MNTLYFTPFKSLFIHNDYPKSDEYKEAGTSRNFIKGDPEGFPIFIDKKAGVLHCKSDYQAVKTLYIFKETIPTVDWMIQKESRMIGQFLCFRAKGVFGGRTYNVWFTPDIPVSFGPYKLGGLPGLILEAYSEDGMVKYTFQSFEASTADNPILEEPKNGKEISQEAFKELVVAKLLNAESLSTPAYTITNEDPPADFYIEKNQYTIISTYKKEREHKRKP
ncbi:MAG: GLPGLI family protein [Haliscomenobacter sp.]|nr:GLPGLI family protein [Haliscomenobacter sp.]MBK9488587.1 GLPGLI family protein [Haliscomenobacter sp.]